MKILIVSFLAFLLIGINSPVFAWDQTVGKVHELYAKCLTNEDGNGNVNPTCTIIYNDIGDITFINIDTNDRFGVLGTGLFLSDYFISTSGGGGDTDLNGFNFYTVRRDSDDQLTVYVTDPNDTYYNIILRVVDPDDVPAVSSVTQGEYYIMSGLIVIAGIGVVDLVRRMYAVKKFI